MSLDAVLTLVFCVSPLCVDVDDEYEDEEDHWEEGAEDLLEKGEGMMFHSAGVVGCIFPLC